jgi:hypothetical protein
MGSLIKPGTTAASIVFMLSALIVLKFRFASYNVLLTNTPVTDLTTFNMDLLVVIALT